MTLQQCWRQNERQILFRWQADFLYEFFLIYTHFSIKLSVVWKFWRNILQFCNKIRNDEERALLLSDSFTVGNLWLNKFVLDLLVQVFCDPMATKIQFSVRNFHLFGKIFK